MMVKKDNKDHTYHESNREQIQVLWPEYLSEDDEFSFEDIEEEHLLPSNFNVWCGEENRKKSVANYLTVIVKPS